MRTKLPDTIVYENSIYWLLEQWEEDEVIVATLKTAVDEEYFTNRINTQESALERVQANVEAIESEIERLNDLKDLIVVEQS